MGSSTARTRSAPKDMYTTSTHLDICTSNIRMLFSTLLIEEAGRAARATGVQDDKDDTTRWTNEGRSLMRVLQLFTIAVMISGFLQKRE